MQADTADERHENNDMTPVFGVMNIARRMPGRSSNSTNSRRRTQRRGRATTWKLLTPIVLWTIVILAMTPSLHGFGVARIPGVGKSSGVAAGGGGGGLACATGEAALAGKTAGVAGVGSAGWGQRGGSWLKERLRDGGRRLHMQMMSMAPETALDAKRFDEAPVPAADRAFLINGWRWHSRAVLRDVARFRRVAMLAAETGAGPDGGGKEGQLAVERVLKSYRYMWSFSFAKLHKCETSLFFPWLRELLPREALSALEEFDRERDAVVRIGNKIGQFVEDAVMACAANGSPRPALLRCADLSSELEGKAAVLARVQESAIVPYTAAYVSAKEQGRFNDKVILSLGLLDAQVLLVSMHDAIKSDREEFGLFRSQVPKFARALIPTWRRVLYSPRAGCLDDKTADMALD